jgi:nucleoside-diphosphate-sugar epimerase
MRAAESLVGSFAGAAALPVGVARLEGLYGAGLPEGRDDTLLGALVHGGITRRAVHLPTPWDGWLWPLHVRDAARGVHQLLISQESTPITFAGASPFRMRELVANVERILDAPLSVSVDRLDERRAGAPPPIALARRLLRWRPSVGLFSGLEELASSAGPAIAHRGSGPGAT